MAARFLRRIPLLWRPLPKTRQKVRHLTREDFTGPEVTFRPTGIPTISSRADQSGVKLVSWPTPTTQSLLTPWGYPGRNTPDTAVAYHLESGWCLGAPVLSDVIRAARTAEIPVVLDGGGHASRRRKISGLHRGGVDLAVFMAARTRGRIPSPAA